MHANGSAAAGKCAPKVKLFPLWMKEAHKTLPTRTSTSHPITVSWLDAAAPAGALGLCYCPGKNVVREGVRWARDLEEDLQDLLVRHGVAVVVCLLSDAELRALGVGRDYAARVNAAGLDLIQFPIIEMFAPEDMVSQPHDVHVFTLHRKIFIHMGICKYMYEYASVCICKYDR
jgi:hypothetical protein